MNNIMDPSRGPSDSRGGIGGAANEAGGEYRASIAAWVVARCLRGLPLPAVDLPEERAIPLRVLLEGDRGVDDIDVETRGGGHVLLQAKRRLGFGTAPASSMRSVVEQWTQAVAEGLNPQTDRLVVVTARPTEEVRRLGEALTSTRREVAVVSRPQAAALAKLRGLLAGVPSPQREAVLRMAVVLPLETEQEGVADAERGELLLDGVVVAHGEGRRAWRHLVREARSLAARRFGATAEGWMQVLRKEGLTLVADAAGALSARLEARRLAVGRYRHQLEDRASRLELSVLGAPLPPLPFDEAGMELLVSSDPEVVEVGDRSAQGNRRPEMAFRRRGRSILTGLPGAGKSTALTRAAGYWAAREDWPIPILVRLSELVRRMDEEGLWDVLIRMAVAEIDPADRSLVEDAIREGLRTGDAALFLDGLDETRERRHEVVTKLRRALSTVNADAEVVLSTRDIAYADARTLGFPSVRLQPPVRTKRALERILQAYAEMRGVTGDAREPWVENRLEWIDRAREDQQELKESPLMEVLLAVLAGERDDGALPTDQAHVLREVVIDIVRRWETRRGTRPTVGPLEGEEAIHALLEAYECISGLLSVRGSSSEQELLSAVADMLKGERWTLPPARAEATARDVLGFWDEAGIFIATGAPPIVEPRVRLFVEVGEAMRVMGLAEELQRAWVRQAAGDPGAHEALALAATLSPAAADALVDEAIRRRSRSLHALSVRCIRQGATVTPERLFRLAHHLERRLGSPPADAWEAAQLLADLAVPQELQNRVLWKIRDLPPPHDTVATALLCLRWGREDEGLEEVLFQLLEIERLPSLRRKPRGQDLRQQLVFATVDSGFVEAILLAAARLLPAHPDLAERLMELSYERLPASANTRMASLLSSLGHHDVVRAHWAKRPFGLGAFAQWQDRLRLGWEGFLASLRKLSSPAPLTPGQARRVDELADFVATLRIGESYGGFEVAASRGDDDLRRLLRAYADLGDFDPGVLAAEAQVLSDLDPDGIGLETVLFVFDDSRPRPLDWARVADHRQTLNDLVSMLSGWEWIAETAARALDDYPDPEVLIESVDTVIPTLLPRNREVAAWVVVFAEQDPGPRVERWVRSADPVLRTVAGRMLAATWKKGRQVREDLLRAALSDQDDAVRHSVLTELQGADLSTALRAKVRRAERQAPSGWQCPECDARNAPSADECRKCRRHAPHLPVVIR